MNVVAVSATNSTDTRPSWSNYGTYVDLAAPGESILTTQFSDYRYVSGTSFSSPITAATVALMASIQPKLTNTEIVDLLLKNSDDIGAVGYDVYYGHGRVNAARAVAAAHATYSADTTAPIAAITSPGDGAILSGTVSIAASANDNVGVTKTELLIDGVLVAQATGGTLAFNWDTAGAGDGSHSIQARAYDAANNVSTAAITVSVSNLSTPDATAPLASITSPSDGATVSGTTKISVAASDDVGVTKLELYIDGKFFGSSTASSATFSWNTRREAKGAHTLQAYAYDAAGNIGASAPIKVYK